MSDKKTAMAALDALLPQTQCGDCSYKGCLPYAEAIISNNERIDRCLPGGVATLRAIADRLKRDPEPFIAAMQTKAKPRTVAIIREDDCIGCTKCIQACPVDAIMGSGKLMHTVIEAECSGCELCIAPCPVDCIDLVPTDTPWTETHKAHAKQRYQHHNARLLSIQQDKALKYHQAKMAQTTASASPQQTLDARKQMIADAITRTKAKKAGNHE